MCRRAVLTSSVLRSRQTPLSRSSQWVEPQATSSSRGAHHVKPTSTSAEAMPPSSITSPWAMKSMFMNIGGPVHPRSKSRAVVRSLVRSPRSRWPTPSGPRVAAISRSLSTELKWWPSSAPTTWWRGGETWETTKTTPNTTSGMVRAAPSCDPADQQAGGDREGRRHQRPEQEQQPPGRGEAGHGSGHGQEEARGRPLAHTGQHPSRRRGHAVTLERLADTRPPTFRPAYAVLRACQQRGRPTWSRARRATGRVDREEFTRWARARQHHLLRAALLMTDDRARAEDLVQDALTPGRDALEHGCGRAAPTPMPAR